LRERREEKREALGGAVELEVVGRGGEESEEDRVGSEGLGADLRRRSSSS
jgi:hypothetical protein